MDTCTLPPTYTLGTYALCKEHNTYPFPTPTALLLYFITSSLHHFITYLPTYITLITAFLSFNLFSFHFLQLLRAHRDLSFSFPFLTNLIEK